jgi:zinc protease
MTASLLDEGAGDLSSEQFQQRLENNAIEMNFRAGRDEFRGNLRVLRERKDEAFELLRLALTAPRFDPPAIERIRAQVMTALRRDSTNPGDIANKLWWRTAFADHPYGRPVNGTLDSIPLIGRDDLTKYVRNVFARAKLKIAVVGDIDPVALGAALDRVFGKLPEQPQLVPVAVAQPGELGRRIFVDLDVPQAVLSFGGAGLFRKDPDFIPAFIVNHILGGGSFSSRLYQEVREKRGLAYSVYSYLLPLEYAALVMGGTQTRADRTDETLDLIQAQVHRLAEQGPTEEELAKAKSYLKGSYALNFDTSTKIAAQLVQIQLDELGIDYITRREKLIDAVTLDDVKRVARRLLDGGLLFTVVGRSQAAPAAKQGG